MKRVEVAVALAIRDAKDAMDYIHIHSVDLVAFGYLIQRSISDVQTYRCLTDQQNSFLDSVTAFPFVDPSFSVVCRICRSFQL